MDTVLRRVVTGFVLLLIAPVSLAQSGLTLSRNSDYSTQDVQFEPGDMLYVLVEAPELNALEIDENELRLRHENAGEEIRFRLENEFNARYTAGVQLPNEEWARGQWSLEIRLRDRLEHEFRARLQLAVGEIMQHQGFEIEGLVTEIGDGLIGVMHRQIRVTAMTRVENEAGQAIRFSEIEVGHRVRVRGMIGHDGALVALKIQLRLHEGENEVEFSGVIQEVFDVGIVMFGRRIEVHDDTEIHGENGRTIPFSELRAGLMARVKVRLEMERIVALRIRVRAANDFTFEVKGTITAIHDRGFDLENHFIAVAEQTQYFGPGGEELTFSDLGIGVFVQVQGTLSDELVPTALRVKVEDRPGPREFEVRGFVREKSDDAILLTWGTGTGTARPEFALKILVTPDTRILDREDQPIRFEDLQVGDFVEVYGFVNENGDPIALKIEIEDPDRREITVAGAIQEIGDRMLVVRSIPFEVTENTRIVDEMGQPIHFSDLAEGMFVKVEGYFVPATRKAVAVEIHVRTEKYVYLIGTINEIGTDAISVSGIRVFVTPDTHIFDVDGNSIEFADLQVGWVVRVVGWKTEGGVVAKTIKVRLRVEDEVLVAGVLEAVESDQITVLGVPFRLLSTTVLLDESGNEITPAGLEIGKAVAVRGDLLDDGTFVAYKVKKLARDVRGIHVIGPVESTTESTIEVVGIHFFVDGSTRIVDVLGQTIGLADVPLGATVEVHAIGLPDGTRRAQRIRILDVLVLTGNADSVSDDRVQILGREFLLDSDLLVMLDGGRAGLLTSADASSLVEIRAATAETGEMLVSKVTIHQESQSTTIDTEPTGEGLPRSFVLGQNYPNPFNPSTTIELEVFEAGPVELTVYNILGQRVTTLVEGAMKAGTYAFVWNGTDATGAPVASGLYLYRARVSSTVQTRTMALIK